MAFFNKYAWRMWIRYIQRIKKMTLARALLRLFPRPLMGEVAENHVSVGPGEMLISRAVKMVCF